MGDNIADDPPVAEVEESSNIQTPAVSEAATAESTATIIETSTTVVQEESIIDVTSSVLTDSLSISSIRISTSVTESVKVVPIEEETIDVPVPPVGIDEFATITSVPCCKESPTASRRLSGVTDILHNGYIGHLSEKQNATMLAFINDVPIVQLESAKFTVESMEQVALRFLRARQFDVVKAKALLSECYTKMNEGNATECANTSPDMNAQCDVLALKNWYPHTTRGYDKLGRPILWEHSGKNNPSAISQMTTKENLIRYHWMTMEKVLDDAFTNSNHTMNTDGNYSTNSSSSSNESNRNNSSSNDDGADRFTALNQNIATLVILDFNGFGLQHCSSKMMEHAKTLVAIDNVCYPEILGKMIVINAPWLAVSTYSIVKTWLDPRTQSKIEIIGSGPETTKKLLQYIPIDILPKAYGGLGSDLFTSKPNAEMDFTSIPRAGTVSKTISVKPDHVFTCDSYITDGPVDFIVSYINESSPSTTATAITSSSKKNGTIIKQETVAGCKSNNEPTRVVYTFPPSPDTLTYTVTWSNASRFYTRPLLYVLTTSSSSL